ncbi:MULTISPECIES: polysaccharide deacetylase family protein [unclassified Caballeronia]|uniref:polysaccharide deacetylase family protein n=1 Tax=unclassified Caballeronia TaxID=2646786 RepID=UPI002854E13D|nr:MULTISPECIES: polysaccharide deacetylase family protein [unclassified Caballeronia]MDR5738739.1 polysaccharide deacetylase family protein [Caballeronia sp. LZ016]MDR5811392.1 polysaccharide deacetylase family protein [Caballeronia sp. LZ019]
MFKKAILTLLLVTAAACSYAAGPSAVAIGDRATWPRPLNSADDFNLASRAELLAFGRALADTESLADTQLQARLKVKSFDRASVDRIRARFWTRLTANYLAASAGCASAAPFCEKVRDEADFVRAAKSFATPASGDYRSWSIQAATFHATYVNELLRLAALFPRISSEIDTYSSREIDGSGLPDRTFLLTFDDGPTARDGSTDQLLQVLHAVHLNGVFFTLGAQLQARLQQAGASATKDAYRGMCVGSHGWEHRSHSAWASWQDSVTRSIGLVRANLPDSAVSLFRPPYGQRRADSGEFFASQGLSVALWNIDSQDWNDKVSADEVKQRVMTLMLLWRRGIILFHDIHPKAQVAVPWLHRQFGDAGVQWMDCKRFVAANAGDGR